MQWPQLWLSLLLSTGLAVGLVKLSLLAGFKDQLALILPLLPLCNAVIFPALEKLSPSEEHRLSLRMEGGSTTRRRWSGRLEPIFMGLAAGLTLNMLMDFASFAVFQYFAVGKSWPEIWQYLFRHLFPWFLGGLNPFSGPWRLVYLGIEMLMVSVLAGVCVGLLSTSQALLNGLITGSILAICTGSSHYVSVYEVISNSTWRIFNQKLGMSWEWAYGVLLCLSIQVMLCAVFGGLAFRWKTKPGRAGKL